MKNIGNRYPFRSLSFVCSRRQDFFHLIIDREGSKTHKLVRAASSSQPSPRRRFNALACFAFFAQFIGSSFAFADASPIVHPGDTLGVQVLNYAAVIDDSSDRLKSLEPGEVIVAADGSISLPVAGTLHVAGKDTNAIAELITYKLSNYVRQPSVTVELVHQSQLLFLTGATVGTLTYLPGEALATALGQLREQFEKDAGSALTPSDKNGGTLTRSAIDLRRIVIQRDRQRLSPIDGEQLLASGLPGPMLAPGDIVRFASKPVHVIVRGQVAAPGPVFLYQSDTLEQALQQAGGTLATASTANATLIRDGKETPLPLGGAGLRQVPESGDIVVVRAAPHVTVIGQVPNPGELVLRNGSTLLSALYVAGGPTKWANVRNIQVIHEGARTSYDLTGLQHGDLSSNVPLEDGDVVYVPEGHRIDPTLFFQAIGDTLTGAFDATHI